MFEAKVKNNTDQIFDVILRFVYLRLIEQFYYFDEQIKVLALFVIQGPELFY